MEDGYHKLEVYKLAHSLAIKVHQLTLRLPKFEMFEEGNQIRRSAKSVPSNIVEGYVLRKYKKEYLHFLYRAQASSEETVQHLKMLFEIGSVKEKELHNELKSSYDQLNAMLFRFIQAVEERHGEPMYLKELEADYGHTNLNLES